MKKITKGVLILFLVILTTFTTLTFIGSESYGAPGETKYFSLYQRTGSNSRNGRPTGFYTSGVQNGGDNNKVPIVKIIETNGTQDSATQKPGTDKEAIYCLNNNVGFGTGSNNNAIEYTTSYDMRTLDVSNNSLSLVSRKKL